jgi:hypothetical protein
MREGGGRKVRCGGTTGTRLREREWGVSHALGSARATTGEAKQGRTRVGTGARTVTGGTPVAQVYAALKAPAGVGGGGGGGEAEAEEEQLGLLAQMGFGDAESNRRLLRECGGDVNRVVDAVLAGLAADPPPAP